MAGTEREQPPDGQSPEEQSPDEQTYYQMLGVHERAGFDEIEDAYHALARELHPDVTGDDPDATARYMLVNEAYHVLSDGEKREKYDASIGLEKYVEEKVAETVRQQVVRKPRRVGVSDMKQLDRKLKLSVRKARMLIRQGDFWTATRLLQGFLSTHGDNVDLRRALAQAAAGRHRYHEAVEHQRIVCRVEFHNADNYAELGSIYLRAGQLDRAERSLNEALSWNSEHEGAKRDLEKIRRIRESRKPLFSRLIGKIADAVESKRK